jgi:hypothetical protein
MKVGWMDMSAGAAGDTASGEKIDCELESNKVRLYKGPYWTKKNTALDFVKT